MIKLKTAILRLLSERPMAHIRLRWLLFLLEKEWERVYDEPLIDSKFYKGTFGVEISKFTQTLERLIKRGKIMETTVEELGGKWKGYKLAVEVKLELPPKVEKFIARFAKRYIKKRLTDIENEIEKHVAHRSMKTLLTMAP